MDDIVDVIPSCLRSACLGTRELIGAKPPLRPKHVSCIQTKLQGFGLRDLAMFNLGVDSNCAGAILSA
jgi:hypothetical protein